MNILIVIGSRIPVEGYGGTQRVMWYLGRELSKMGHSVSFLAAEGSWCPFAKMHILRPDVPLSKQIPEDTDIVHFNESVPADFTEKPYVVTHHGNRISQPISRNAIFVSSNHAKRFGSESFVYNGLDWDDYATTPLPTRRAWFHFLGKAAWSVKNVRGCISIVKALQGERLYVLGGHRLNFKMGFRLTFSPRVRFCGMVGGEEKLRYLCGSKGLLFPVLWDEPFGLAIIESLYCGAPVFATPYGSLPELVSPEVGFLSTSKQAMIEHLRGAEGAYSPAVCREYAATLFNSRLMAQRYLSKYEQVLSGKSLNEKAPHPILPFERYEFN